MGLGDESESRLEKSRREEDEVRLGEGKTAVCVRAREKEWAKVTDIRKADWVDEWNSPPLFLES